MPRSWRTARHLWLKAAVQIFFARFNSRVCALFNKAWVWRRLLLARCGVKGGISGMGSLESERITGGLAASLGNTEEGLAVAAVPVWPFGG